MATTNSVPFPVYGQAFRVGVAFRDNQGNLLTGWMGAAATAYPDGGSGTSVTIAESPAGSGIGFVDVPAALMACSLVSVVSTVTNSNATAVVSSIYPLRLAPFVGRWDAQTPLRFEQMALDLYSGMGLNGAATDGVSLTLKNPDGSTKFAASLSQGSAVGTRGVTQ